MGFVDVLTVVWLVLSAGAHLHGGLPWLAADQLADPVLSKSNPILKAYVEWCITDTRYCAQDACVMSFQGITLAYAAPGCLLLALLILTGSRWRHIVQIPLCGGQVYGTLIYFVSAAVKHFTAINPDPVHFWALFVGLNALWIVIPGALFVQSLRKFKSLLDAERRRKAQ